MSQFLFFLFFISLLTSQSAMDFSMTLIVLWGIWNVWIQKKTAPSALTQKFPFLNYFLIFWFLTILAGFVLNQPSVKPLKNILEFRWVFELYFLTILLVETHWTEKKLKAILGIYLLSCAYAVIVFWMGYDPMTQTPADIAKNIDYIWNWRAGGFFREYMPFAHSYSMILCLLFGLIIAQTTNLKNILSKKINLLLFLTFLVAVLAIYYSFTRGVWLGLLFSLPVTYFIYNRKHARWFLYILTSLFAVAFFTSERLRNRVVESIDGRYLGDSERRVLWEANLRMIQDHPWFGLGYSQNRYHLREYYDLMQIPPGFFEAHAHNQYLQMAAGTGIIGLLCYLFFAGFGLFINWKLIQILKKINPPAGLNIAMGLALGTMAAQISFHIGSLTESNFSISKNRFMFIFIYALVSSLYLKNLKNTNVQTHHLS